MIRLWEVRTLQQDPIQERNQSPNTFPLTSALQPGLFTKDPLWRPVRMHQTPRKREQPRYQLRHLSHIHKRAEGCGEYCEGDASDLCEWAELKPAFVWVVRKGCIDGKAERTIWEAVPSEEEDEPRGREVHVYVSWPRVSVRSGG